MTEDESRTVFAIGEVLSETYEVRSVIGEGAMGQVLEAHDLRLHRRVAVKVAWPQVGSSAICHEAQALAAIKHPGLVTVYAIGVHRGHEYVVMERIHGTTLEETLARLQLAAEPVPVQQVILWLSAVCDALSAVHGAGLVHRDLKPANIMLTPGGHVMLLDFGLFLPQFEPGKQAKIVGSPTYMAPEFIRNRVESGSWHLLDIYALGVLAFELLAGEPPFRGESVRAVFEAHVRSEVPDLSETRPDTPPALAALIREMLAKSPMERPQTAESVLSALQRIGSRLQARCQKAPFEVIVASANRAATKALSVVIRRAVPDAAVQRVQDGEALIEHAGLRPPKVVLIDPALPGPHVLELCMFLRGVAPGCTLAFLGDPPFDIDAALMQHLKVGTLPALESEAVERVGMMIRAARRQA